jgi:hypothetical protein
VRGSSPSGRTMWRGVAAARRRMCKSASRLVNPHRPIPLTVGETLW